MGLTIENAPDGERVVTALAADDLVALGGNGDYYAELASVQQWAVGKNIIPIGRYSGDLDAAVAAIDVVGNSGESFTIVLDQATTMSTAVDLSSLSNATAVNLVFLPGGVISLDDYDLTITNQIPLSVNWQIFNYDGTGTVVFSGPRFVGSDWWGAVGDDSTDDVSALQYALAATPIQDGVYWMQGGKTGIYKITAELTIDNGRITIKGNGCTIHQTTVAANGFNITQKYSPTIHDLILQGSGYYEYSYDGASVEDATEVGDPSTGTGIYVDAGAGNAWNDSLHIYNMLIYGWGNGIKNDSGNALFDFYMVDTRVALNGFGVNLYCASYAMTFINWTRVKTEMNGVNIDIRNGNTFNWNHVISQYHRGTSYGMIFYQLLGCHFDNLYHEFSTPPADAVGLSHPTDNETVADIITNKFFAYIVSCQRCIFTNVYMQDYRLGYVVKYCKHMKFENVLQTGRQNLTMSSVGYNASFILYSQSESSNYANVTFVSTPQPIVSNYNAASHSAYTYIDTEQIQIYSTVAKMMQITGGVVGYYGIDTYTQAITTTIMLLDPVNGVYNFSNLPSSDPSVAGQLWYDTTDGDTVKMSTP